MRLNTKISAVYKVLKQAEKHAQTFSKKSNLTCLQGCYQCCTKTDIAATVLEFLPAARGLYLSNQHEELLTRIEQATDDRCIFLNPFVEGGGCSHYEYRGLICRLFGFSAHTDKAGNQVWSSCKVMKTPENNLKALKRLSAAPGMQPYYLKLYGIDPVMSTKYFPINEAIQKAIESVIMNERYRRKPA